jgi:hypothetical protein
MTSKLVMLFNLASETVGHNLVMYRYRKIVQRFPMRLVHHNP